MLDRLDSIDWGSLQHAYGSAADVPDNLRALMSDDDAVRSEALHELFGSVWHQGTIYSVSAHVVPFLLELLTAPMVKDKPSIIVLLASIAGGRGYYEVHEDAVRKIAKRPVDVSGQRAEEKKAVDAVRRIASPHLPELIPHLMHAESEVRLSVAEALPLYPEHFTLSKSALERARLLESDEQVSEAIDEALSQIGHAG